MLEIIGRPENWDAMHPRGEAFLSNPNGGLRIERRGQTLVDHHQQYNVTRIIEVDYLGDGNGHKDFRPIYILER